MKPDRLAQFRHMGNCSVCTRKTDWTCPECAMYADARIWLCPSKDCRKIHYTMCGVAVAAN
jgi:hypothetical protein